MSKPLEDEKYKQAIETYSKGLSRFLTKKSMMFLQKGTHSQEEVWQIINNYNTVLEMYSKNYNIDYKPIEIQEILNNLEVDTNSPKEESKFTPSNINEVTRQALKEKPGILGEIVGKLKTRLEKNKGENNKDARN